jgi:hypothetical protein
VERFKMMFTKITIAASAFSGALALKPNQRKNQMALSNQMCGWRDDHDLELKWHFGTKSGTTDRENSKTGDPVVFGTPTSDLNESLSAGPWKKQKGSTAAYHPLVNIDDDEAAPDKYFSPPKEARARSIDSGIEELYDKTARRRSQNWQVWNEKYQEDEPVKQGQRRVFGIADRQLDKDYNNGALRMTWDDWRPESPGALHVHEKLLDDQYYVNQRNKEFHAPKRQAPYFDIAYDEAKAQQYFDAQKKQAADALVHNDMFAAFVGKSENVPALVTAMEKRRLTNGAQPADFAMYTLRQLQKGFGAGIGVEHANPKGERGPYNPNTDGLTWIKPGTQTMRFRDWLTLAKSIHDRIGGDAKADKDGFCDAANPHFKTIDPAKRKALIDAYRALVANKKARMRALQYFFKGKLIADTLTRGKQGMFSGKTAWKNKWQAASTNITVMRKRCDLLQTWYLAFVNVAEEKPEKCVEVKTVSVEIKTVEKDLKQVNKKLQKKKTDEKALLAKQEYEEKISELKRRQYETDNLLDNSAARWGSFCMAVHHIREVLTTEDRIWTALPIKIKEMMNDAVTKVATKAKIKGKMAGALQKKMEDGQQVADKKKEINRLMREKIQQTVSEAEAKLKSLTFDEECVLIEEKSLKIQRDQLECQKAKITEMRERGAFDAWCGYSTNSDMRHPDGKEFTDHPIVQAFEKAIVQYNQKLAALQKKKEIFKAMKTKLTEKLQKAMIKLPIQAE